MAVATFSTVSAGGTWKTPSPNCGIAVPPGRSIVGISMLFVMY